MCRYAAKWKSVGNILPRLVLVAELAGYFPSGVLWHWLRFYMEPLQALVHGLPGWACNLDDGSPPSSRGGSHGLRQGLSSSTEPLGKLLIIIA